MWVGDALHGPRVGDRKTYLFAFLDDHSRLAVGYRFGFAEDAVRLAAALRPALASRGVPAGIYVDNGSAFCDAWLYGHARNSVCAWCIRHPADPKGGQDRTVVSQRAHSSSSRSPTPLARTSPP
nr:transposase family protein [Mycolicibacterium agri]